MKGAPFSSPLHPHSRLTSLGNRPFLSPFLKFFAQAQPGAAGLVPDCIRGGGYRSAWVVSPSSFCWGSPETSRQHIWGSGRKVSRPCCGLCYCVKNKRTPVPHLNLIPHQHHFYLHPQMNTRLWEVSLFLCESHLMSYISLHSSIFSESVVLVN